jgi:predicted DNA-binding transcriptional regulator YafY
MRAGRLLTLLLLLQEQGRTTTAVLAARLEVSRRTVLRDVAALGGAGVPVVTWAGRGGGVELMPGWRTALGTLTLDQAAGLWLGGQPLLARAVGLSLPAQAARAALLDALPEPFREAAEGQWLVIDPETPGREVSPVLLRDAARACREGLELVVTTDVERALRPVRLVLRGGRWWLEERDGCSVPLDGVGAHRWGPAFVPTNPGHLPV